MDNGIVVRAYARLFAEARSQPNADEVYIDVVSAVGRLRIGEKAGVNTSTIGDPVPQAFLTVYDEVVGDALVSRTGVTLKDAFTFRRFTGNALGISYQTPELFGVRLGVTYHPTPLRGEGPINNIVLPHNAIDVTAGYEGYYSGGTYRVAAGYFHSGSSHLGNDGVEAWNISAGLTYGGWELAGAYMNAASRQQSAREGLDDRRALWDWVVAGFRRLSRVYAVAIRRRGHQGTRRPCDASNSL